MSDAAFSFQYYHVLLWMLVIILTPTLVSYQGQLSCTQFGLVSCVSIDELHIVAGRDPGYICKKS